jgi:hypothetical protein
MNQFREDLGLAPGPTGDGPWKAGPSSINTAATLEIDGEDVPAFEIDTDPFVYALGAQIRPDVVTTVVIARDHLPHVRMALRTRTPAAAQPVRGRPAVWAFGGTTRFDARRA